MKVSLTGALLVALLLVLFAGQGAGATMVQPVPSDACGNDFVDVPDSGRLFDFTEACLGHDDCYGLGGTESDRRACDNAFLADMQASCDQMWPGQFFKRRACYSVATTYYLGARLGGWAFFEYGGNDK